MMSSGSPVPWGLTLVVGLCVLAAGATNAQETVTIAAALGISGPGSIAQASVALDTGLKDCVAMANLEGGVNGKKLRYVMLDDHYKAEEGLRTFEQLMSTEHPLAVFGSGTPAALAVQPLLRERYRVLYSSSSFSAKLAFGGMSSLFVPGPTYGDQIGVALKYIARENKNVTVAFFYSKGSLGEDPIPYGRIACRNLRLSLVAEVTGNIQGGDHTEQIEELKRKNPDFVIIHGWVSRANAPLIKQCHELGLKSQIVVTLWGAEKSVIEALGPDGPAFLAVSPYAYWWMEGLPALDAIKKYTTTHYPDVESRPLSYIVAFTAGKIFVECLRRAEKKGKLNGEGVVAALQTLKDFDTGGLTPPLTIKDNRFPVARVLKSNPRQGTFEPVTDWIRFY
jgi:branched-chain amino acid transport system substrate-binding protein